MQWKKRILTLISKALDYFKDYYKTLEIEPGASTTHIKKSWRRLIQLHHPDKQIGSAPHSIAFQEIQEAYETLTNPLKKQKYLAQRWLHQVTREEIVYAPKTSEELYFTCIQLENKLASFRHTRIDEDYYRQYILLLFSAENIAKLQTEKSVPLLNQSVQLILKAIDAFSIKGQKSVLAQLEKVNIPDSQAGLEEFKKKNKLYWLLDAYQLFIAGVLTLLLVGLIASLAN